MGLLTGLVTLPLAPVRGTMWIAELLARQAALELGDERTREELHAAEERFEAGEMTLEELEAIEDRLLDRLELARREEVAR